ncbi:MAG: hypothetical protein EAZ60_26310 [Oscillatoriales cyanobacterium]|nr:MAG: hypothetical protein EAZ83_25985 [Oscillatoriales cyanobacterium]TAE96808.1 MAG: hypothetical protein EAZ79_13220 [Oscillatoriales cyanobacterium]TAF15345.1 MAG: hypothetical protein EAZ73_27075 [Oscillatoriales cyanobacterium]TAF30763.1 MAG: hypothetical protein EAZ69_21250 [Oscillatoriales cyanobacterium]TAF51374.1 MAG: hypothetical protein EAZ60_26310 [Oscillatoriales cyanobacterium]
MNKLKGKKIANIFAYQPSTVNCYKKLLSVSDCKKCNDRLHFLHKFVAKCNIRDKLLKKVLISFFW